MWRGSLRSEIAWTCLETAAADSDFVATVVH